MINEVSLRQTIVAPELMGRVNADTDSCVRLHASWASLSRAWRVKASA